MNNSLLNKGRWLWQKIKPRGRLGLVSIFLLASVSLFVIFVAGVHPAHADLGSTLSEWFGNLVLGLAATFMSITVFILKFVLEIASYNHYINAPAVTLGWVLVRDVTNMFFVLILMVIAFGTVLGIEQYEWKKLLVKFVMAAILVNFSRLICGVIIDAAQVFMMTFISGAAATAGGNLVNALHMNDILAFATDAKPEALSTDINVLVSAIVACIFAFTAMLVIGAYLLMLIARVIALWICIILSPLAFVLGVIPKFQSYASQWWTEFTNNVLSGPVLAFFLWLAFAVAGGANIHDEFTGTNSGYPITDAETAMAEAASATGGEPSMNLNKVLQWENLANFILAAALLLAGVKTTQKLSAAGSGMLGAAAGAATKFAMVASGAAAGMAAAKWGVSTAGKGAKAVGKGIVMNVPLVGGNAWKERGMFLKDKGIALKNAWNRGPGGGVDAGYMRSHLQIGGHKARMEDWEKRHKARSDSEAAQTVGATGKFKDETAKFEERAIAASRFKDEAINRRKLGAIQTLEKEDPDFVDRSYKAAAKAEAIKNQISEEEKKAGIKTKIQLQNEGGTTKEGLAFSVANEAAREAKIEATQFSNLYTSKEQVKELQRIEELLKQENSAYSEGQKESDTVKADIERKELLQKRGAEMRVATAKNLAYEERVGEKTTMFTDYVISKHNKEDSEFFAPLNADKLLSSIERMKIKMDTTNDPAKKEAYSSELNDMVFAAQGRSPSLGLKAMALTGFNRGSQHGNFEAGNVEAQQADYLSRKLGKRVGANAGDVKRAFDEWKGKMGVKFNGELTSDINQMEQMADNGAVELAGMFVTDSNGDWTPVDVKNTEHEKFRTTKVLQASQRARGKTKGLAGAVDRHIADNGSVKLSMASEAARANIANLFSGITIARAQTTAHEDITDFEKMLSGVVQPEKEMWDRMSKAEQHAWVVEQQSVVEQFQDLVNKIRSTTTDPRGVQALFKRLPEKIKSALENEIEVDNTKKMDNKNPAPRIKLFKTELGGNDSDAPPDS